MAFEITEWMSSLLGDKEERNWDWNDILFEIDSYTEFEELISELWEYLGYETTMTRDGADGGYDIFAKKSGLFRGPNTIVIEAKWWTDDEVPRPMVQKLEGVRSAEGADTAVLITSSVFNSKAKAWAENEDTIELLNGKDLIDRLNESSLEPPDVEFHSES